MKEKYLKPTVRTKRRIIYGAFHLAVIVMGTMAFGQEMTPFFKGVRDEGMGGANVATVNDETAIFVNPAGLGKIRGPYIALINPEVETNYETTSAIGGNLSGYLGAQDPNALLSLTEKNPGANVHAKFQIMPAFVTTNFGLGGYAKYNLNAQYNAATSNMSYSYVNDYAAAIAYCFRLWEGRIKIGFMGKADNRVQINTTIPQAATGLSIAGLASEGTGVGWDTGIILTAPWTWLPTLSAVVHDVGNTYFTLGNGLVYNTTTRPGPQMQEVDAGLAVFPYNGKYTRASITAQFNDVQKPKCINIPNGSLTRLIF